MLTRTASSLASASRAVICLAALALALGVAPPATAEEESQPAKGGLTFAKDVKPILQAHCAECHSKKKRKANLDLGNLKGVLEGGDSGAAVKPGHADESYLFEMVHEGYMPPEGEGKPLNAEQVETIRRWIEAGAPAGTAAPAVASGPEVTQHDIIPLMLLRCTVCHGLREQEAGLDLRTPASMLRGGKSGPAIVPGKPEESLVLKRIRAGEMPPRKRLREVSVHPMSEDEVARLAKWIELGCPEVEMQPDVATREPDPLVIDEERQFWSFQPPERPAVPEVEGSDRVRNPIDAFVIRRLEKEGLSLSDEADKLALLRRVTFDLTGLPPTPQQVETFLADDEPQAYERLVDRLLASPHYGERMARHWLDLAGYADSEGKRSADPIRPHAWRYRDYVIRAFNEDKPYDRFLLEQLAGDELADYASAEAIDRQMMDNLVATGFLRMAPDGTGSDVVNFVPERLEVIADEIDVLGSTVLGLTLKCARCHSHKYDPIPQRDYYRLMDVFKGAFDEHDWLKPSAVPGQTKAKGPGRVLAHVTPEVREQHKELNAKIQREIDEQRAELKKKADALKKEILEKRLAEVPEEARPDVRRMLATPEKERDEALKELAKKYEKQLTVGDKDLEKLDDAYKAMKRTVDRRIKALEATKQPAPAIRALWDRGEPSPTYIYQRGDHTMPGRLVGPGVPSVLTDGRTPFEVEPPWPGAKKTGRRLAFAEWLVEPDHPLTARVMVNRIWSWHFGRGIVRSVSNFGKLGTPPSHPELLDWLATEFVQRGWSIKDMHRLMMTSSTYRQSSHLSPELEEKDPKNEWFSRMPLKRMEAEVVRDSLLAVAGRLDAEPYGPGDAVRARGDGLVTSLPGEEGWRRSIYVRHRRKEIPTILDVFDLPQMNPNCVERRTSTVASQALHLFNDAMVRELADAFADRVAAEAGEDPARQVEHAYLVALAREPTSEEREVSLAALEELTRRWEASLEERAQQEARHKALASFCHALVNSAAFLYVD